MAEIQETVESDNSTPILNNADDVKNLEVDNPEEDIPLEVLKIKEDSTEESATVIQQFKELVATFEKLVKRIQPQDSDDPDEEVEVQDINSFYDLHRLWQEQVSNLTTIQNLQAEDFQKQILELNQSRQNLLDDLENQGHSHLVEVDQLKKQFIIDMEAKDQICLELEEQIVRMREDHENSVSCSICLDPWNLSGHHRLVSLACGHLFGDTCIRESLTKHSSCPQCRAFASPGEIRYLYGRPL